MARTVTIRMSDQSYLLALDMARKFGYHKGLNDETDVQDFLSDFLDEYSKEWYEEVGEARIRLPRTAGDVMRAKDQRVRGHVRRRR